MEIEFDHVQRIENQKMLRDEIEKLDRVDREIVTLKALSELTFQQVSHIVDLPMKTVATRFRRALSKLESRLKGKVDVGT